MSDALQYFGETQHLVRDSVGKFVAREISPHVETWEEAGEIPRELYRKAGAAGILGIGHPQRWGGSGPDVFSKIAATEALMEAGSGGVVASLGSLDIGLPPVWQWAGEELQRRICPEVIADRAMGNPTKGLKMVQPDVIAAAEAHEAKDPTGVKGEGAIAFGGGQVIGKAGMDYLREFDAAQFDDEEPSAAPSAEQSPELTSA